MKWQKDQFRDGCYLCTEIGWKIAKSYPFGRGWDIVDDRGKVVDTRARLVDAKRAAEEAYARRRDGGET